MDDFTKHRLMLGDLQNYNDYSELYAIEGTLKSLRTNINKEEQRLLNENKSLYGQDASELNLLKILHSNCMALYYQLMTFPCGFQTVYVINKFTDDGKISDEYLEKPLAMVIINIKSIKNTIIGHDLYFKEYTIVESKELFKENKNSRDCKKYKVYQSDINKKVFASLEYAELMLKAKDLLVKNDTYNSISSFLLKIIKNTLNSTLDYGNAVDMKERVMVKTQGCFGDAPFYAITNIKVQEINCNNIIRSRHEGIEQAIVIEHKKANDLTKEHKLLTLEEVINKIVDLAINNNLNASTKIVFKEADDTDCRWLESFNALYNAFDMPEGEADAEFVNKFGRNLIQIGIM